MTSYPVLRRFTRVSGHYGPRDPIYLGGGRWSPAFHGGTDFTPNAEGKALVARTGQQLGVYAVGAGTIYGVNLGGGAAGLNVMLRLDRDGSLWWYGHLSSIAVAKGQRVADGQRIGRMGATGNTTGVHLHLERHYPQIDVDTDPWPTIRDARDAEGYTSSWQTGTPPAPIGDAGSTEKTDEEQIMALSDATKKELRELFAGELEREARLIESRVRREVRPEVYYISEDAEGREYGIDDSPAAVAVQPASGFLLPLNPPDEHGRGQVRSLKANYRIIGFDSVPQGFPERIFYNTIKDVARGAGIIDRNISEADGVAWARALFTA